MASVVDDNLQLSSEQNCNCFSKAWLPYSGGSSVEHWGGPFHSRRRGWQNSLQRAWLAENFPEYPYITEDSHYIASNNCGA